MIDEAHERTITTDVLLALLKKVQRYHRPDLRLVISSATLDAQAFVDYFENDGDKDDKSNNVLATRNGRVGVVLVDGSAFPVDLHYLNKPCEDYIEASVHTALAICQQVAIGEPIFIMNNTHYFPVDVIFC